MINYTLKKINDENILLKLLLASLGFLIIAFNVMGYDILFNADKFLGLVTPFGILLGVTEIAVLCWSSAIIKKWPSINLILKISLFVVVTAFAFLSYSGVSSYLNNLATNDVQEAIVVEKQSNTKQGLIESLESDLKKKISDLTRIKKTNEGRDEQIAANVASISLTNQRSSDRRKLSSVCDDNVDCAEAVKKFTEEVNRLVKRNSDLENSVKKDEEEIKRLTLEVSEGTNELRKLQSKIVENNNAHATSLVSHDNKKSMYSNIVENVYDFLGFEKPSDPFSIFISFISVLIYPIYFLLNLFLALQSEENLAVRRKKSDRKERKFSVRAAILKHIRTLVSCLLLRKKKEWKHKRQRRAEDRSVRARLYQRQIKYFRVWAHRRTKTKQVEVETIVEIPTEVEVEVEVEKVVEKEVEVEKIVEVEVIKEIEIEVTKEVPVEIKVEIPVEVDRIVKVETEVPIYVDKVKEVEVPFFVKDPQILVHERLIVVPENITGEELEKILKDQPTLNAEAREHQKNLASEDSEYQEKSQQAVANA